MKTPRLLVGAPLLALFALHPSFGQSSDATVTGPSRLLTLDKPPAIAFGPPVSSSVDDAAPVAAPATAGNGTAALTSIREEHTYRPFLSYNIAFRLGTGGIGGEVATPLAKRLDLRVGAEAFSYTTTFTTNGLDATGSLKLGDTFATLDYHPFRNGFRISPGLTLYNRNNVAANLNVPGGNTFTLNDVDYTSEATDPITGTTGATFGNKVAPRLTFGWANLFPRYGGHWSFPVELGFYYTSYPKVAIALSGSACSSQGCGSIDTPDNEANIQGEEVKLNNDLAPARFFPVFSLGVGYRFGH